MTSPNQAPHSLQPRPHLYGCTDLEDLDLPSLESVRKDAARIPELVREVQKGEIHAFLEENLGELDKALPLEPLFYNIRLPLFFEWAYLIHVIDVPDDLLEDCIFALKMLSRVVEESDTSTLETIGHISPDQNVDDSKYFMLRNIRSKLGHHLLNPKIHRPLEAVPFLKAAIDARIEMFPSVQRPWMTDPQFYALHGIALAFSHCDDEEAILSLQTALEGFSNLEIMMHDPTIIQLQLRIHLSRVLRRLGKDPEGMKGHEGWVVKFLRKNPNFVPQVPLSQIFLHSGEPVDEDPILNALGGLTWLEKPKSTYKADVRMDRICRRCKFRETNKTLFRCSGCQIMWYCSKECQKADWPSHKALCRDTADTLRKIRVMKLFDLVGAQRMDDWSKWQSKGSDVFAFTQALGLHRDSTRGRTHIFIGTVEYTPEASKDVKHKFRVAECGVFRIADTITDIEEIKHWKKGEAKKYIDKFMNTLGTDWVPILRLLFGRGIEAIIITACVSINVLYQIPHDPEWRNAMNIDRPPAKLRLKSGVKDVEHVF